MRAANRLPFVCTLVSLLMAAPSLFARGGDRFQIGKTLYVASDEAVSDVACIGCSIHVEGYCGKAVAVGGNIDVSGETTGDVVAIGGTIRLYENAEVGGNVVTVGGSILRHPNASVKGNTSTGLGLPYLIGFVVVPLLPVILLVALIVWLVRRNRSSRASRPAFRA